MHRDLEFQESFTGLLLVKPAPHTGKRQENPYLRALAPLHGFLAGHAEGTVQYEAARRGGGRAHGPREVASGYNREGWAEGRSEHSPGMWPHTAAA